MKASMRWIVNAGAVVLVCQLLSCQKESPSMLPQQSTTPVPTTGFKVLGQEANQIALNQHFKPQKTGNARVSADDKPVRRIKSNTLIEDALYIVNYEGDAGYMLVAADRRVTPILSYSDEGQFDPGRLPEGLSHWYKFALAEIKAVKKNQKNANPGITKLWETYLNEGILKRKEHKGGRASASECDSYCNESYVTDIQPLLTTLWSQGTGYNFLCPSRECGPCGKAYAGCGPVALAQVMNYYKKPTSYNGVNFSYIPDMPTTIYGSCGAPSTNDMRVSELIRQAGEMPNSHYFSPKCNTYTWSGNLDEAFSASGYAGSGSLEYFDTGTLKSELRSRHPVIMVGTHNDDINEAHIWVCDGVYEYFRRYADPNHPCDPDPAHPVYQCISEGGQYFHMNWGWGPGYNNWCVAGDFTGDGTRYNNWLRILVNVRP
jgi:hypothetical protein